MSEPNTITLRDYFSTEAAKALLYSGKLSSDEAGKLKALVARSGGRGFVPVVYTEEPVGRFKSHVPGADGKKGKWVPHFMTGISSEVRGALASDKARDLDIQACHPTLLAAICDRIGLHAPFIKECGDRCKEIREEISEACDVKVGAAKALINRIAYGGVISVWAKENNVDESSVPPFVKNLYNEIQENRPKILEHYPECVEFQKTAKPDHWNPDASALSYVIQNAEKACLKAMYEFANNEKLVVHTLMHDGLTVARPVIDGEIEKGPINKAVLTKMAAFVKVKTGFVVNIVEKPMSAALLDGVKPVVIANDDEASDRFMEHYDGLVVKDGDRVMVYIDGLWYSGGHVDEVLVKMCLSIDLVKETAKGFVPYSKDIPAAKRIVAAVRAKLPQTPGFVNSLFMSSLGYLMFKDGVYEFASACFIPFASDKDIRDRVRSTVRVERDFPERNEDNIAEVYKTILDPIFPDPERKAYFLRSCARGMAGHYEDKEWLTCVGDRNAGKGVIVGCFEAAFGGYIGSFNADAFMYRTNIGDSAKERSWMLDHEFQRIIFSNECTNDPSRKLKLNGNMIKTFNSGGDFMTARKNYQDERSFRVQSRMVLMINDLPPVRPADALETMVQVAFETVFKVSLDEGAMPHMRLADPGIKSFIARPEMRDAFLHIVLDHYSATRPKKPECVSEDTALWADNDGFRESFSAHYEVTGVEADVIPCNQVLAAFADLGLSPTKIGLELKKLGVRSKNIRNTKCYLGVKEANGFEG